MENQGGRKKSRIYLRSSLNFEFRGARFRNFAVITPVTRLLFIILAIAEACLSPCEFAWCSTRVPFISWPVDTRSLHWSMAASRTRNFRRRTIFNEIFIVDGVKRNARSFIVQDPSNRCVESLGNFPPNRESITTHSLSKEIKKDLKAETSPRNGMFSKLDVWTTRSFLVTRSLCDFFFFFWKGRDVEIVSTNLFSRNIILFVNLEIFIRSFQNFQRCEK